MTQTTTFIQKTNKRDKGKIISHYKLLRLLASQKIILFLFYKNTTFEMKLVINPHNL